MCVFFLEQPYFYHFHSPGIFQCVSDFIVVFRIVLQAIFRWHHRVFSAFLLCLLSLMCVNRFETSTCNYISGHFFFFITFKQVFYFTPRSEWFHKTKSIEFYAYKIIRERVFFLFWIFDRETHLLQILRIFDPNIIWSRKSRDVTYSSMCAHLHINSISMLDFRQLKDKKGKVKKTSNENETAITSHAMMHIICTNKFSLLTVGKYHYIMRFQYPDFMVFHMTEREEERMKERHSLSKS